MDAGGPPLIGGDPVVALYHRRRQLAKEMSDIVKNPAKYNNADVLDYLRDRAKAANLEFFTRRDGRQRGMIHCFVCDKRTERPDPRPKFENPQYLGWVQRNMEPTTGG